MNCLEKDISLGLFGNSSQTIFIREIIWLLLGAHSMSELINSCHSLKSPYFNSLNFVLHQVDTISFKLSELRSFVTYFNIQFLDDFNSEILLNQKSSQLFYSNIVKNHFFTLTFQAFASGINFFLTEVGFDFHLFEKEVKNIGYVSILDSFSSIISISDRISLIYQIYRECTKLLRSSTKTTPLKAVIWLIDTLWRYLHIFTIKTWRDNSSSSIISRVFLITLLPQLNMISHWLTHGIIIDLNNEFFITQCQNSLHFSDLYSLWRGKCQLIVENDKTLCPEIFKVLAHKIYSAGKSLGPLEVLGISLGTIELENFCSSFVKKICELTHNCDISHDSNVTSSFQRLKIADLVISKHTSEPFISVAMLKSYQLSEIKLPHYFDSKFYHTLIWDIFSKFNPKVITKPLPILLSNYLYNSVMPFYLFSTERLMSFLTEQDNIFAKFYLLYKIYLFGDSFIMDQFSTEIFLLYKMNELKRDPLYLTTKLNHFIYLYLACEDIKEMFIVSIDNSGTLNDVKIHYNSEPLSSIFFGKPILQVYQRIFSFLLDIKWILWTLNNICLSNSRKKIQFTQNILLIQQYNFYISVLWQYFLQQVILKEYLIFKSVFLSQSNDVDNLVKAHENFIFSVQTKCFLDGKHERLRELISQLILKISHFCVGLHMKDPSYNVYDINLCVNTLIRKLFTILRIHNSDAQLNFLALSFDFNNFISQNVLPAYL